jgi:predicted RNA binding protein YcfA (HicA-like mRNA interferase family)
LKESKSTSKLLSKAKNNPAGLRFTELRNLCEEVGMVLDRTKGSHFIYKHSNPSITLPIQDKDGKAKAYQVRELLGFIEKYDLTEKE